MSALAALLHGQPVAFWLAAAALLAGAGLGLGERMARAGAGGLAAALLAVALPHLPSVQAVAFVAAGLAAGLVGRTPAPAEAVPEPAGAEADARLIGRVARASAAFAEDAGEVTIDGEARPARLAPAVGPAHAEAPASEAPAPGARVRVVRVEGAVLVVRPAEG